MVAPVPEAQGDAPFLQPRTEILGAVDRIEQGDPAVMTNPVSGETLLARQHEVGQTRGQPIGDAALQQQVRLGDRTAIRLPVDVMAPGNELRQAFCHQRADPIEQIHVIAHAASRRFTAV